MIKGHCLCGNIAFENKVLNAQSGGATAAIVYNNVAGNFGGTLSTPTATTIPSVSMSMEDGQEIIASKLNQSTTVSTIANNNTSAYASLDGTSMATPHVAGVAAIVWSSKPTATNQQIRDALTSTAEDLGATGRDNNFGYGLVRAFNAAESLTAPPAAGPTSLTVTNIGTVKGKTNFRLNWSAGTSTVDIFRGTSKIASAITNSGTYTNAVKTSGSGSFSYRVCNAGSSTCSATVSVNY